MSSNNPVIEKAALEQDLWCAIHRMLGTGDLSELHDLNLYQLRTLLPRVLPGTPVATIIQARIEDLEQWTKTFRIA